MCDLFTITSALLTCPHSLYKCAFLSATIPHSLLASLHVVMVFMCFPLRQWSRSSTEETDEGLQEEYWTSDHWIFVWASKFRLYCGCSPTGDHRSHPCVVTSHSSQDITCWHEQEGCWCKNCLCLCRSWVHGVGCPEREPFSDMKCALNTRVTIFLRRLR